MEWDELKDKWMAIRLSDGGYDGSLYDSKRDAVRRQSDEFLCAYLCFRNMMSGVTPREMEIFLKWNRDAYDAGFRLPDPDDICGGPEVIMTTPRYDQISASVPRLSPREEAEAAKALGITPLDFEMMARILG